MGRDNSKITKRDRGRFDAFLLISTFAKSLIEVFISLYLFKNGFSLHLVLVFYLLENIFCIIMSYCFVKIGEKYNYGIVMCVGVVSFIVLQFVLGHLAHDYNYVLLISFLYAVYRKGYWVARRFYVTEIMPKRDSSVPYSIVMAVSEFGSIMAGFVGGFLLDSFHNSTLIILSSFLLVLSVLPLFGIENRSRKKTKIELIKNIKRYNKKNLLAFTLFEINNLLTFLFPIYVFLYVENTYTMAGAVNAANGLAIIIITLIYGRIIKNKDFFVVSSILFILISFSKLLFLNYFILFINFIEGIIKNMQTQSLGKIYFESRNGMDLAHYNLIYQLVESLARAIVAVPLLFMSDVRLMIVFVLLVIGVELTIYAFLRKDRRLY